MVGYQAMPCERIADELLHVELADLHLRLQRLRDQLERRRPDGVHLLARALVLQILRLAPARLELLNQVRRRLYLDAERTHQFERPAIYHRNVGHRTVRRILHRHRPAAGQHLGQRLALLLPACVEPLVARQSRQHLGLDLVRHAARLALGLHQVIPAPGQHLPRIKLQHPVGQRVAPVVVEKQPAVQPFAPQGLADLVDTHESTVRQPAERASGPSSGCGATLWRSAPAGRWA